ncbi:MAG: hypothetical protein GY871_08420 [Actinomycetales bacterium]|nr:hypothetical protein [Actinomycetales bacterium]
MSDLILRRFVEGTGELKTCIHGKWYTYGWYQCVITGDNVGNAWYNHTDDVFEEKHPAWCEKCGRGRYACSGHDCGNKGASIYG